MQPTVTIRPFPCKKQPGAQILFDKDPAKEVSLQSVSLLQKKIGALTEQLDQQIATLPQQIKTLSIKQHIHIQINGNQQLDGSNYLKQLQRYYPQIIWVFGQKINQRVYELAYIPIVLHEAGFPVTFSLTNSLVQQGITEKDSVDIWEKELNYTLQKYLLPINKPEKPKEKVQIYEKEKFYSGENIKQNEKKLDSLENEKEQLAKEIKHLTAQNEELNESLSKARKIAIKSVETPALSGKDRLYFEEEIKREKDAKERMRLTKEKLEYEISRLEKKVMDSGLDLLEQEPPYVKRKEDWHKVKKIPLKEYDQLYQKAKYLEHTWTINQQLVGTTERMVIKEAEITYERERVKKIKNSAKDIELFVMMDECRMIHERVKIKKGSFFRKPFARILKGDYENIVEKAAYFDVLQSENRLLEKIIEAKEAEKISG